MDYRIFNVRMWSLSTRIQAGWGGGAGGRWSRGEEEEEGGGGGRGTLDYIVSSEGL